MPGVGSSIPLIAAPFLSTSKYCPKILKLEASSRSISQSLLTLVLFASSKSCPVKTLFEKPSLSVDEKENLVATLSLTGTLLVTLYLVKP